MFYRQDSIFVYSLYYEFPHFHRFTFHLVTPLGGHKGNRTLSPNRYVHHLHLAYIEGIEPPQVNFSVTLTHERLWFYLQQLLKLKTCVRLVVSHLLCMVSTRSSDINTLEGGVELFASPSRGYWKRVILSRDFFSSVGICPMSFHLIRYGLSPRCKSQQLLVCIWNQISEYLIDISSFFFSDVVHIHENT